jgi:hypothetical protein
VPGRELVTERDVLALPAGSQLVLGPGRIATPAALDAAFLRGIRVVRQEDGGSAAGGASDSELLQRLRSQDGTFVVVVREGRLTISRIGPGGPEPFAAD